MILQKNCWWISQFVWKENEEPFGDLVMLIGDFDELHRIFALFQLHRS